MMDRCLAQGQHAKRDELGVEIFALARWESGSAAGLSTGDVLTGIN